MKIKIEPTRNNQKCPEYYIVIDNLCYDAEISKFLNLTIDEYHNILFKHNAELWPNNEIMFKLREDAVRAVQELEPYLIMVLLKGEQYGT